MLGSALVRTARLYVVEGNGTPPRELTHAELEGVGVKNGATLLELKDGRLLSGVSVRRSDLQQAIAILKAVGIPGWGGSRALQGNAVRAETPAFDKAKELRQLLKQIEPLLAFRLQPEQVERASTLAISLARSAPPGPISNLAMHLVSALHEARRQENREIVRAVYARLCAAVDPVSPGPDAPAE